jgi:hypothetical protein
MVVIILSLWAVGLHVGLLILFVKFRKTQKHLSKLPAQKAQALVYANLREGLY